MATLARSAATARNAAVGTLRTGRSTAAPKVTVNNHFHLTNHGAIGSPSEMRDWLARSLDDLYRTNRLPRSLRSA